jgi:predicted metalloprotease with PDZ domain
MAYNCILILRSSTPEESIYLNQTNKQIQKIGMHRIRAMELLQIMFTTINKI